MGYFVTITPNSGHQTELVQLSLEPPPLTHHALAAMNQPPQEVVWNIPQPFDGLMQCGPQLLNHHLAQ